MAPVRKVMTNPSDGGFRAIDIEGKQALQCGVDMVRTGGEALV